MLTRWFLLGLCLVIVLLFAAAAGAAVVTERVSLTDYGGSPNGASWWPSFALDGRLVAFYSGGGNMVPEDTNHVYDVFLRDRLFGTVELVSLSSLAGIGNGASYEPAISRDGRYVAFTTAATNLIPGDNNGVTDVVVRDLDAGLTLLASVSPTGSVADGESLWCSISEDGRYVAFQSSATNLIPGDTINWPGIYLRDMVAGTTQYISRPDAGGHADEISIKPSITPDGRYIAYRSYATNLVPGDTNGFSDVFLYDRNGGVTERVSVATLTGAQGNGETLGRPGVTPDGRYVVFSSAADNLVPDDTNGKWDVFVRDRTTGTTERLSVSSAGVEGNDDSGYDAPAVAISDDGRYVSFASAASNLAPNDTNGMWDVFVRDRVAGTTERVSVSTAGAEGNDHSGRVSIALAPDGQTVAFDSLASNLVLIDTNRTPDVFVRGEPLAPQAPMLVINDGAEFTTSPDVTLSIDPGSYPELRFANEGEDWTDWEPATFTRAWTLTSGDGLKRVYIQGRDGLALSVEDYAEITLDTAPPTSLSIIINNNDPSTISRTVTLRLHATGAAQMRFRNETSAWSPWLPYTSTGGWKLSHDRGAKSVGMQCRDASGNVSAEVTDTIDLICFTDVCTGFWDFEEIMACVDAAVVQGYPEGDYKPALAVSRDQMAVYIARSLAEGEANVPPGPPVATFPDVPTDNWAYDHIEYTVSQGVVQGYDDGEYKPLVEVDRAQMAVYIARSIATPIGEAGLVGYNPPATPTFPDVPTDFWAYKHVEYCAEQGVVKGYPFDDPDNPGEIINLYQPDWVVTRDQMAAYIQRAFSLPMD
ncbi:MAG: S-layer homology domain-containing protein [Armatimonadota bacterium]